MDRPVDCIQWLVFRDFIDGAWLSDANIFIHLHVNCWAMATAAELLFPKLVVFGATGQTGLAVVQQALEKGHAVTAVARNPESFPIK